jgi:hypothetical protein
MDQFSEWFQSDAIALSLGHVNAAPDGMSYLCSVYDILLTIIGGHLAECYHQVMIDMRLAVKGVLCDEVRHWAIRPEI